ncbi:MAG: DUF4199 domain-containing protein [Flavobacteriaceae bacterium]
MKPTTKQNSVNLGLYLGATLSFITVLFFAVNLDLMIKWWVSLLSLTTVIVFGVLAAKKAKSTLGGFIDFKGAFSNYFITVALGIGISTFVSIAIFSFIDTDSAAYLNEQILIVTKESMERFNAPEELVAQTLLEASKKDNFSIATQLQNYVFFLAFISLLGLIVAAIIKKSDTNKA